MQLQVTLVCGWCARESEVAAAPVQRHAGRPVIVAAIGRPRSAGRPVCAHCRGPLFVGGWETIRAVEPVDAAAVAPPRRGRPRKAVA